MSSVNTVSLLCRWLRESDSREMSDIYFAAYYNRVYGKLLQVAEKRTNHDWDKSGALVNETMFNFLERMTVTRPAAAKQVNSLLATLEFGEAGTLLGKQAQGWVKKAKAIINTSSRFCLEHCLDSKEEECEEAARRLNETLKAVTNQAKVFYKLNPDIKKIVKMLSGLGVPQIGYLTTSVIYRVISSYRNTTERTGITFAGVPRNKVIEAKENTRLVPVEVTEFDNIGGAGGTGIGANNPEQELEKKVAQKYKYEFKREIDKRLRKELLKAEKNLKEALVRVAQWDRREVSDKKRTRYKKQLVTAQEAYNREVRRYEARRIIVREAGKKTIPELAENLGITVDQVRYHRQKIRTILGPVLEKVRKR